MPDAPFKVGDLVQWINAADKIGVVRAVRVHPQVGALFCEVAVGAMVVSVPADVLRHFEAATTPWDELRAGTASGADAFRLALTHSRVTRPPSRMGADRS